MLNLAGGFNMERVAIYLSMSIIVVLTILVFLGDSIAPHSPTEGIIQDRLLPPVWQNGGSKKYLLGTDSLGRCILSRTMSGAKYSLVISVVSVVLSAVIGVSAGLISGFLGGVAGSVIMGVVDLLLAFPTLVLGLLLGITLGPSMSTMIIVMVIAQWARFTRQVHGEVLSLKESDFVAYAHMCGCSSARIILRYLLPNVMNTVLVFMSLQVGWTIIFESSLSFLGAGIPPPLPGWGLMVADGREYITRAWWVSLIPGGAIMITILAFNTMGDWVRDRLDPHLRQL
jgi:peptide/nickel transport system permease protein